MLFKELLVGETALKMGVKENLVVWASSFSLWTVTFFLYLFVAQALSIQVGFFEMLVILAVSSLSTIIPSAPGYIGTFEAGFLISFAAFGLDLEQAAAMAIVVHLLFLAATTVLGLFSLKELNVSFFDLTKTSSKESEGGQTRARFSWKNKKD